MNGSVAMLRRDIRSIPRRLGSRDAHNQSIQPVLEIVGDEREAVGFVKALGAVLAGEKFELPIVVLGIDGQLFQAVEFVHGFSVGGCPKQEPRTLFGIPEHGPRSAYFGDPGRRIRPIA